MKKLIFILLLPFLSLAAFAQTDTSTPQQQADTVAVIKPTVKRKLAKRRISVDSLRRRRQVDSLLRNDTTINKDSTGSGTIATNRTTITKAIEPASTKGPIDSFYLKLLDNPFLRSKSKPVFLVINERQRTSKDEVFYLLLGLISFLAFIKLLFSRYFQNLFRLFFQPSFRQKQTREQLQQGNLPSLLLNLFFIFSTAAYISFLLDYYHVVTVGFWLLLVYSALSLIILYTGKFIFLSFAGWVFNVREATSAYIFAVYLINKILGVVLVPFTLVIAFSKTNIKNISITISVLLILMLFIYRYVMSYGPVRREVRVSPVHFFFYVLAFEITPLLLIYKTLMLYLNKSL
ncbi:DUF4271 domain-containing protein [Segetibacter sp.]|uniref:DUF4271 domain-containing protein n=1 Tax=Segetibacter sp. TaxID=2231182 RepID=UPI0026150043|nr:DUF4271 domain-containing protein [Segetibacter sp.]MCW3081151.1 hypothetical protein [Segetibacter sp.]